MGIGETLTGLPYFEDLDPSVIEAVESRSERVTFPAGSVIIEEGSSADEMYVILSGDVEVTKLSQGRDVVLATLGPGDVVGEMAMLDGSPRTATVRTATQSEMVKVPQAAVEDLVRDPALVRRMFRTVTSRLRDIEDTLRHEERMSALGRMAAQLMHELNNPAAAVARSSGALFDVHQRLGAAAIEIARSAMDISDRVTSPSSPDELDPLARGEREDEIAEWLSALEVEDPWSLAPALADDGWTKGDLDRAVDGLDRDQMRAVAQWIGLRCLSHQLIDEVRIGTGRISELVRVVKEYSFLDQAPVQEIDPTVGINDTLILMKGKLKNVKVSTEFAEGLHRVEASGRDLNQVWTNLIDNAADAMNEQGDLSITARNEGDEVVIDVSDTGGGIDPAIADKLFDPFFTTKQPGKGTGLGLHTVHTIIARAGGSIVANSLNGGTTFTVRLPKSGGEANRSDDPADGRDSS